MLQRFHYGLLFRCRNLKDKQDNQIVVYLKNKRAEDEHDMLSATYHVPRLNFRSLS